MFNNNFKENFLQKNHYCCLPFKFPLSNKIILEILSQRNLKNNVAYKYESQGRKVPPLWNITEI